MTLRRARRLASKVGARLDVGHYYAASDGTLLPQLRSMIGTGRWNEDSYLKTLDQMITKHGPNAEFVCNRRPQGEQEMTPNKEGKDEGLDKDSADIESDGSSDALSDSDESQGGRPGDSESKKGSAEAEDGSSSGTGPASVDGNNEGTNGGPPSSGQQTNPSRGQNKPHDGEGTGRTEQSNPDGQPGSANSQDRQDRHVDQGSPSSADPTEGTGRDSLSEEFGESGRDGGFPTVKQVAKMRDTLAPHHPYGEGNGAEPSYQVTDSEAPSPSASDALQEFRAAEDGPNLHAVATNRNPGGTTTDMLESAFFHGPGGESNIGAVSIRRMKPVMERLFKALEVGTFGNPIPKIDSRKLVKELVGKSYRLGRCAVESMETGIKILLIDNSGSCHAICGPAMACALELAKDDPDIVIYVHSNSWFEDNGNSSTDASHPSLIGARADEVRLITKTNNDAGPSGDSPRSFGNIMKGSPIAGVVAFGDWDAEDWYKQIAASDVPFIWIDSSRSNRAYDVPDDGLLYIPCHDYRSPGGFSVGAILQGLDDAKHSV